MQTAGVVRPTNFRQIAKGVDVAAIRAELAHNPDAWLLNTRRQRRLECQRETESIQLRVADAPRGSPVEDVHEVRNSAIALRFPTTLHWLRATAKVLGGRLERVLFARLRPQGRVYRHFDRGAYYACRRRYHLVIDSAEGSPMVCGDERLVMHEGEVWEIDNKKFHEASNPSSTPRVHLIFDLLEADSWK